MHRETHNAAAADPVGPFGRTDPNRPVRLLLTPCDAAAALSISERSLWSLSYPRGPIGVVRIGRAVRYDVEDLRAWIEASKERPQIAP